VFPPSPWKNFWEALNVMEKTMPAAARIASRSDFVNIDSRVARGLGLKSIVFPSLSVSSKGASLSSSHRLARLRASSATGPWVSFLNVPPIDGVVKAHDVQHVGQRVNLDRFVLRERAVELPGDPRHAGIEAGLIEGLEFVGHGELLLRSNSRGKFLIIPVRYKLGKCTDYSKSPGSIYDAAGSSTLLPDSLQSAAWMPVQSVTRLELRGRTATAGLSCVEYVEQLTMLLFLKMADQLTEPPYSQKPDRTWGIGLEDAQRLSGAALEEQYSQSIEKLLAQRRNARRDLQGRAVRYPQSGAVCSSLIVNLIDKEDWLNCRLMSKGRSTRNCCSGRHLNRQTGPGNTSPPAR